MIRPLLNLSLFPRALDASPHQNFPGRQGTSGTQQDMSTLQSKIPLAGRDLTSGSVARNLFFFAVPILLGNAIHTAYSIINAAWVGNGLGATAMAAITVSFPIVFVLLAVAGGLSLATNILVSQSYGAKNWERLGRLVPNSLVLTVVASGICLAAGHFGANLLVSVMNTPAEVQPVAVSYLRLFILTTPLMFIMFHISAVLRGMGDSRTPLYFQAGSLLMGGVLDPFLMFGWLGVPRFGLNGTALATILAQASSVTALSLYLRRRGHLAAPSLRHWRVDPRLSLLTLKVGLPSMVQQALVALGFLVVISLVNRFGTHSAAAYGIALRIDQLAIMPAMAMGMATSTLSGQNIGARRFDRVREVLRWGVTMGCLLTLPATMISLGIPSWVMGLFAPDQDVVQTGAYYLRVAGVSYLLVAAMFATNGVINGAGRTVATTIFTLVVFWIVRIPLALLLSNALGRVEGIWYGILASYIIGVTLSLTYYQSGRWKKPVTLAAQARAHAAEETAETSPMSDSPAL